MAIIRRGEAAPITRRGAGGGFSPLQALQELMSWDPFQELGPQLWRGGERGLAFAPSFDVRETKDSYIFKADLPGFREQDLDIQVTGNRLTVSGRREAEQVDDADTYYAQERTYGSFSRSFTLPEGVDADHVQAQLTDGVLTLHVPKVPEVQPKRIALGSGQPSEKKVKA